MNNKMVKRAPVCDEEAAVRFPSKEEEEQIKVGLVLKLLFSDQ